jgi:hypothetical protein
VHTPRNAGIIVLALSCAGQSAAAQLSGSNAVGDFGLKSGSQAPPGWYVGYFLYDYAASSIAVEGGEVELRDGGVNLSAHSPLLSWVSGWKIFGGSYGALAIVPIQNVSVEAPRAGLRSVSDFGLGDIYVQPINLGWHPSGADVLAWYAFWAPTGDYHAGENGNRGLGMWTHEVALGTTWYLLSDQSLQLSALATFELHTEKEDTEVEVGDLLTIEGGFGGTVRQLVNVGLAYYLQWKVTDDTGLELAPLVDNRLGKNRNFGLGPELTATVPLAADFGQLLTMSVRYIFEVGSHMDTKGNVFVFTAMVKAR